jgi:hypothetical protein
MTRRYHVFAPKRMTPQMFDLAKGTSLMAAMVRNAVTIEARHEFANNGSTEFYRDRITHLTEAMEQFLDVTASGLYFPRQEGDQQTVYFSKAQDALAFKLRFHQTGD